MTPFGTPLVLDGYVATRDSRETARGLKLKNQKLRENARKKEHSMKRKTGMKSGQYWEEKYRIYEDLTG